MPDTRFPRRATSARTAPAGPSSLPHTDDAAPRRSYAGGGTDDSPHSDSPNVPQPADGADAGSARHSPQHDSPDTPLAESFAAFVADPPDDLTSDAIGLGKEFGWWKS